MNQNKLSFWRVLYQSGIDGRTLKKQARINAKLAFGETLKHALEDSIKDS